MSASPVTTKSSLSSAANYLTSQLRQVGIFVALIVIVIIFQILTGGILLQPDNVSNLVVQNSYVLILAIGMVMIIIAGHIDLSVGSIVGFIGAIAGTMAERWGWPWWAAIIASLAVGAIVGVWQGYWVAYFGIPAFIVTLAGMLIFRGLTQVVLGSTQITPFPDPIRALGGGFLPGLGFLFGQLETLTVVIGILIAVVMVVQALRQRAVRRRYNLESEPFIWFLVKLIFTVGLVLVIAYLLASNNGIPIVLVVLGVLVVAYSAMMSRSVFGRHIYAMGGNLNAATLSGVKTKRVTFLLFVNMGVLASLAGLVFAGRLNLANPTNGNGFELDAIAAAFIGGAAVTGGIGTVTGAIIGGLIIGILNNGMSIIGVGTDYQQFIKGIVLLGAVAFDVYNKRRTGSR
ncbi:multiple monosaccharide ABC transporter permease [Galbitalea soli]|uniref:Xylose transport system permease protein XylH n=1 Tax=Galbitalea soli TaxID=1268042 RepID=A0A7C9TRL7_9MICO|nr:multiple monosaccharide ABC transporter permease [Galbitalea soli]NEM92138.1 sugar ABC transporter permease [Galbitalea soli]NYJ31910.1 putative multiple sugar transport system permease protein [Galbitalea soli]